MKKSGWRCYKPDVYAHLRRLPPHGRSPFRRPTLRVGARLRLVLVFGRITFGILSSNQFPFSYRGLASQRKRHPTSSRPCRAYHARERRLIRLRMESFHRRPRDAWRSACPSTTCSRHWHAQTPSGKMLTAPSKTGRAGCDNCEGNNGRNNL